MSTKTPYTVPVLVEHRLLEMGSRVTLARRARGLTQAHLAQVADVGVSTLAALEAGAAGVSLGNFLKVVKALDLLPQVDEWLSPSKDPGMVDFATRKLGGSHAAA